MPPLFLQNSVFTDAVELRDVRRPEAAESERAIVELFRVDDDIFGAIMGGDGEFAGLFRVGDR